MKKLIISFIILNTLSSYGNFEKDLNKLDKNIRKLPQFSELDSLIDDDGYVDYEALDRFHERFDKSTQPDRLSDPTLDYMQQILFKVANQMSKIQSDYLEKFETIGFNDLLNSKRLKSDVNLEDSFQMIKLAEINIERYSARVEAAILDLKEEIYLNSTLSSSQKTVFLNSLDLSMKEASRSRNEILYLEKDNLKKLKKMIQLLKNHKWESISVSDNGVDLDLIIFDDDSINDDYYDYVTGIEYNDSRSISLLQKLQNKALDSLEKISD